jgi:hypothetical protein
MDHTSQRAEAQLYTANLDRTLKELQRKVREHETELQSVCFPPSLQCVMLLEADWAIAPIAPG